jgi:hypothetical protein
MKPYPIAVAPENMQEQAGTRRSFLLGSAGLLTFPVRRAGLAALPVLLADCGGGSGATAPSATPPVQNSLLTLTALPTNGTISLPSGATVSVATVASFFSQATPAANGTFQVTAVKEAPLVVAAYDGAGAPLLMGYAQNGAVSLSANSTAVVLAYFALGVGAYVTEVQLAYLTLIQNAPSLAALESAVAAAIIANGSAWLTTNDTALATALAAVQQALAPAALAAAAPAAAAAAQRAGAQGSTRAAGARAPVAYAAVVDKNDIVSGLQMLTTDTGTLTIENYYRRRSYVYVDEVSYTLPGSAQQIPSPSAVGTQPLMISPTDGVGNFIANLGTALGYASTGQPATFYDPNFSDAIAIPLTPANASSTTYTVTAVGLGTHLGDFAQLSNAQYDGWLNVSLLSYICDLVGPAVANLLLPGMANGFADKFPAFAIALNGAADIANTLGAVPALQDDLKAGNMTALFFDGINAINSTNSIPKLVEIVLNFGQNIALNSAAGAANGPATPPAVISNLVDDVMSFFTLINQSLTAVDTVVQTLQLANSNLADVFTITQSPATILLTPSSQVFIAQTSTGQPYSVALNDADVPGTAILTYNWSCSCNFGLIGTGGNSSPGLGTPSALDSTQANCNYVPATAQALGGDSDWLTVKVFLGSGVSSSLPALGQKSTVITYLAPITPDQAQILPGAPQQLTASMSGRLSNPQPFQYMWTCTGGNGAFPSGATQTTSTPSITYTAKQTANGTDTINLVVKDANGNLVTKGTTTITAQPQFVATITPASPTLNPGQAQSFSVSVAAKSGATLPTGVTYQWSVSGQGTLAAPTNASSASYTAPSTSTTDTLTVKVLDASGTVLATATDSITVQPNIDAWSGTWQATINGTLTLLSFYPEPYTDLPLPLSDFNVLANTNVIVLITYSPFGGVAYFSLTANETTAVDSRGGSYNTMFTLAGGDITAQGVTFPGATVFVPSSMGPVLSP